MTSDSFKYLDKDVQGMINFANRYLNSDFQNNDHDIPLILPVQSMQFHLLHLNHKILMIVLYKVDQKQNYFIFESKLTKLHFSHFSHLKGKITQNRICLINSNSFTQSKYFFAINQEQYYRSLGDLLIKSNMASRDFKFLKLLTKIDSKTIQNTIISSKEPLHADKINLQANNPFILHPFPPVTIAQMPNIVICIARSVEEIPIKNLSLANLEHFVVVNQDSFVKLLSEKTFYCHLFCLAFIRCFQQYTKSNQLQHHLNKIQLFPFINIFCSLLQKRRLKKMAKPIKSQEKQLNSQIHAIFIALALAASAKYIKESQQEELQEVKYVERALISACLMIQQSQNEIQYEVVRQLLSVVSYLLIFNGLAMRPLNLLQFSLNNDQKLYVGKQHNNDVRPEIVQRYMRTLHAYSKKDGRYHEIVLKITKNLLTLNINNAMLLAHFQILVDLIQSDPCPSLKKHVFEMLIDNQSKRNMVIIDQIFICLLGSSIDLLDDDIQKYQLALAEYGDIKRKEKFAIIYYDQYEKSFNRVQEPTINFIFSLYLDQNLAFQKVEIMISKQALVISKDNISKLHAVIRQKKQNKHINLLSIILQKRKDSFEVSNKAPPYPFICEQWLQSAGNNPQVFTTYLKIITETLCGKSLDVYPSLINLHSCIVRVSFNQHSKIQGQFLVRSLEFYSIILKLAEKNDIFEQTVFRYMILLQALLGQKLSLSTFSYFSKNFSKIIHPESTFLMYLEYLVTLLKNKSSVLLYLQSVLEFEMNLTELFFQKRLYDISFLARLIQQSEFFRLSTYSLESVTVIYELSLIVKDQLFQEDYLKIMRCWSSLMSRSQCKNLTYFFAFREIKKIYPFMNERQLKNPSDRIKMIWDLVLNLIDQTGVNGEYISMSPNTLVVSWKGEENAKKDIKIIGTFLRNQSMELFWNIHIKTTTQKSYIISLNNNKVTLEMEQIKQINRQFIQVKQFLKEIKITELKKRPENIEFSLKLQNQSSKKTICHFSILETYLQGYHFDGNIQSITLKCKSNAILKEIKFFDVTQSTQLYQLKDHIHALNQWQIKIESLNKYYLQDFCDKFDFSHAYCSIGEMLKHFAYITIPIAYDIFIRMSTRLIIYMHKKKKFELLQMMVQVFCTIQSKYSTLRGRGKVLKPIIVMEDMKMHTKQLYYLFTYALLPLSFWSNFSEQTKVELTNQIKQLIKNELFREIENSKLTFFNYVLQIACDYENFFEICQLIIQNHELNEILTKKFNKFIVLAKESSIYERPFNSFLEKNLKYLNIQNEKFVENRLRCKFLIVDSCIKQIFNFCTINSKIDLLHYLSQNPSFDANGQPKRLREIKQLMQKMSLNEKYDLMPWLIIQVKQLIRKLKQKTFEQSAYNFRVNYLHLELLILNRNACNEDQKDQIYCFILDLLKILKSNIKGQKYKNQLQNFIHSSTYIEFITDLTSQLLIKYHNINKVNKSDTMAEIYEFSIKIITNFEKNNFLKFLTKYRFKCSQQPKLIKSLIQNDQLKMLKLSHFSIFLQFLFEVLLLLQQRYVSLECHTQEIVASITQYIQVLFHSLDQKTKIGKSLFYSYPHLLGNKESSREPSKIIARLQQESKSVEFMQLRGGMYFKCVIIITKLIKLSPNLDYTNLVDYFLFGPKKTNKTFIKFDQPNPAAIKERSLVQHYLVDVSEQHKIYFSKEDNPLTNTPQNEEMDLNTYIIDYFLINLAEILQQSSQNMDPEILQKYNSMFLMACSNQKINKQIFMLNSENFQILNYDAFNRILKPQSNRINQDDSLPFSLQRIPSTPEKSNLKTQKQGYQSPHSQKDIDYGRSSPTKSIKRSQRRNTFDITSEVKKRTQIFDSIKLDHRNWYRKEVCKNISTYFCQKAKEIRIIELLHMRFVLKNSLCASTITTSSKLRQRYDTNMKKYNDLMKEEKQSIIGQSTLEDKQRKVKKIHPYTSAKSPVLNIIQNSLGNMACPITLKITKTDYRIKRLKSQQSMNMNYYLTKKQSQEELSNIAYEEVESYQNSSGNINSVTEQVIEDEQESHYISKQKPYCELVTRQGVYFCQYQLQSTRLVLNSKIERHICQKLWYLKLGTPDQNLLHAQIQVQIKPEDVFEIFYRRFNQITNNSLQFFMKNGTSRFISFYRKQTLASLMRHLQKIFKGVKIIRDLSKQFEDAKFSQKWTQGLISNFDYLMLLNKYSGRSYNDLNQYYVFPWILKDYHSDKIDLTNIDIYRDLDKPVGALNPEKLKRYKDKYKNQAHNSQRCLYGSHYSASLIIFYYLVRLEPYSSLHRQMQKGTWDVADRLFSSMDQVWQSLMSQSSATDIKQCIPQFYYMPAFLRNIAHIDLGQKQCGTDVGDVQVPPWAQNAEEFVVTLRAALQSDYVSENLHLWIDLIFGKYQNSQEKNNIFHPYSYSDPEVLLKVNSKNHKNIEGIICHISYFGQCPQQLFKKQHKPKKSWNDVRPRSYKSIQTRGNSESTSSQKFWGQASLLPGWKVKNIISENNEFILQLCHITRQDKQYAAISAFANPTALKQSVENFVPFKKGQQKQQHQLKVYVNNSKQIVIGKQFIMDLDFKFNFEHSSLNQLWIVCYGIKGLKIYNWQLQATWNWENEQVKQVNLEPTRLIFSTPNGKLYFYSFLDRKLQQIIVFKVTYDMKIQVLCLPRLPSRDKNQINYKILCVGDGVRVSIVSYTFEQTMNYTSLCRNSLI